MTSIALFVSLLGFLFSTSQAFSSYHLTSPRMNSPGEVTEHPFCNLPGDPSLILTTNVDLGDKKMEIMKACSKAIAKHTGKPESYIAVSITDNAAVIFGGTDAPTALGCLYSIGAIAQETNGFIQNDVTDLLEPYGVAEDRIYINFFDVPRANVGWSRRTFAG
jgi:phenylpyruvate tautomerase